MINIVYGQLVVETVAYRPDTLDFGEVRQRAGLSDSIDSIYWICWIYWIPDRQAPSDRSAAEPVAT